MRHLLVFLVVGFLIASVSAEAQPPARAPGFSLHLGAGLPLPTKLADESGRAVRLGDYFGTVPVVLVLGYFHCPNLCTTLLDGVVESLLRSGLPAGAYRLVAISIDPREGPAEARRRQAGYRDMLPEGHFLTGSEKATRDVAEALGFPYAWDAELGQYAHPAGFVIATPDGRIARYFEGVRFAPQAVQRALGDAAKRRIGSPGERLLLLCAHYNPQTGRYTIAVMNIIRALCVLLAVGLGLWIWRRRPGRT